MTDPLRIVPSASGLRQERPSRFPPASPASPAVENERLEAACREMESLFIHQLLSEMRKTIDRAGLFDGGRAEELYTAFLDAERARAVAASGGLGLSRLLYEQLAPQLPERDRGR